MFKNTLVRLIVVICALSGLLTLTSKAANAQASRKKMFEVEQALNLTLEKCRGDINFPGIGFSGNGLEINGDEVLLLSDNNVAKRGEVIAYARSKYFLDANIAFIFSRSDKPVFSKEWKPPQIISLVLTQNRRDPKQLTLSTVVTENFEYANSVVSCLSAKAVPR
jgi:hypothetical protein